MYIGDIIYDGTSENRGILKLVLYCGCPSLELTLKTGDKKIFTYIERPDLFTEYNIMVECENKIKDRVEDTSILDKI